MSRFAVNGPVGFGDALASHALLRSLTRALIQKGVIDLKTVETIKAEALAEVGHGQNAGVFEARRLISEQFP